MKLFTGLIIFSLAISVQLTPVTVLAVPVPEEGSGSSGGGRGAGTGSGDTAPKSCGEIETSVLDCDNEGGNPIISTVLQLINFLAVGVGIAVAGGIIWGGMLRASSNGDAARVKQGNTTIINAVIGLLLFIFMYAIINFIVPGGVFS